MPEGFLPDDDSVPVIVPGCVNRIADWIRAHSRQVLVAAVFFQLLVLAAMIALHAAPLVFGERILLRVRPVDPRDMFRGDFVVLSYDFSRLQAGMAGLPVRPSWQRPAADDAWLEDRTVYVSLEPDADGKHYVGAGVSFERPTKGRYLKGKVARSWDGNDLHFGIEAFYVEEGHGKSLEQLRNASQLSAEIALTSWGQGTLCSLK
jgi:uncharacterized membrane-anchored protein